MTFREYDKESDLREWPTSHLVVEIAQYTIESRLNGLEWHKQVKRDEIMEELDRRLPHEEK